MLTKEELIKRLENCPSKVGGDEENAHVEADELLLDYINDEDIRKSFENIEKWYA